jgi:hypothetical protein
MPSALRKTSLFVGFLVGWVAQTRHNPEDEDRDGPRNGGLFTVQPLDLADNPKELHCNKKLLTRV